MTGNGDKYSVNQQGKIVRFDRCDGGTRPQRPKLKRAGTPYYAGPSDDGLVTVDGDEADTV